MRGMADPAHHGVVRSPGRRFHQITRLIALAALAASLTTPAHAKNWCESRTCIDRVKLRFQTEHRRAVVRPYRQWLRATRMCESGGNYATNTGNGFLGAYQFVLSTWRSVGGRGMPHHAGKLEQDYRAVVLRRRAGTGPWPVCG